MNQFPGKDWRVLLIDDEEDIREIVSIVLQDLGCIVAVAENGTEGLKKCRKDPPNIVITDVRMPGTNGIEVLEKVKKIDEAIEVIVMTAFGEMELAIRALQLDASDFINKPISREVLHVALERAKQRHTSRRHLKEYTRFLERELKDRTAILHQAKMMSLGRLSASIVHEINNPLAGMLNYFKLMGKILQKRELSSEKIDKFIGYLNLVTGETERCSRIVSNLLAFSRKAEPKIGRVNLVDVMDRCVMLCGHKLEMSDIRLRTAIPNLPEVTGDANQLQQCMINLIFNAVDAMPSGGEIVITAEKKGEEVIIRVEDTGTGIEPADLPHIFEPFFTTKKEGYGVGLGLSTIYGIIEQHGGKIEVTSQKGIGTVFTLHLPL